MKFTSSLRDPVYGVIPVTRIEEEILKLPIMNRLKDIKQLGLAYLAFPGANHTRFEHSAGVMHVASLMATAIDLNEQETETIRIASLLHDVGHPPFSHSIEFASRLFGLSEIPNHKDTTYKRINEDEKLHRLLSKARPLIHVKDVADLAVGKFRALYLQRVIDGPIDADKIDYILRDNHHCGFPVALDIHTITEILSRNANTGIQIAPDGQSFAEQLFMGRYHLISKIHHNRKNRLGNYLLALTLEEAWQNTEEKKSIAKTMTTDWTDWNFIAYLENKAIKRFPILKDFLWGKETFHEICNFGYESLTPYARYSAAILSSFSSSLPKLSKSLSERVKNKELFIDCYTASPPELSLSIGTDPPHLLIDTPLSKGAIDASLKEIHVALYSFQDIREEDVDLNQIVKEYSKELDESMKDKFEGLIKMPWKGDTKSFCLHKTIELVLNSGTIDLRNVEDFTSDLILITANSIYHSFFQVFGRVVAIESLSELARILNDLKKRGFFQRSDGSPMKFYEIPFTEEKGFEFPAQFLVDIEMLETFGLMYRLIKVVKFGKKYSQKYQMRISGWGRGYYQRNLSRVQDLLNLSGRLQKHFTEILVKNKKQYEAMFEKVRKEPSSRTIAQQAKKARKQLPIRVLS